MDLGHPIGLLLIKGGVLPNEGVSFHRVHLSRRIVRKGRVPFEGIVTLSIKKT